MMTSRTSWPVQATGSTPLGANFCHLELSTPGSQTLSLDVLRRPKAEDEGRSSQLGTRRARMELGRGAGRKVGGK